LSDHLSGGTACQTGKMSIFETVMAWQGGWARRQPGHARPQASQGLPLRQACATGATATVAAFGPAWTAPAPAPAPARARPRWHRGPQREATGGDGGAGRSGSVRHQRIHRPRSGKVQECGYKLNAVRDDPGGYRGLAFAIPADDAPGRQFDVLPLDLAALAGVCREDAGSATLVPVTLGVTSGCCTTQPT
jgi:hypothetical protein